MSDPDASGRRVLTFALWLPTAVVRRPVRMAAVVAGAVGQALVVAARSAVLGGSARPATVPSAALHHLATRGAPT
jgi:hypothetical protein